MEDRGMKKWRPFNSVTPSRELLKKDNPISKPDLSKDEISVFEELITDSLYTHSSVTITYLEDGLIKTLSDYVVRIDPIKKNIYLKTKMINFRQIYKVK